MMPSPLYHQAEANLTQLDSITTKKPTMCFYVFKETSTSGQMTNAGL